MQFPGTEMTRPITPKLSDLAERVRWMDEKGIDHQLLGLWTDLEGYELPPEEGLAWSRYINDCAYEELHDQPRFTPLASVPLQDGALAAEVLGEAMERGFGGAMIGTQPNGIRGGNLDDPSLDPFWATASKLGAALFLHPMFVCGEPRLEDYELVNVAWRTAALHCPTPWADLVAITMRFLANLPIRARDLKCCFSTPACLSRPRLNT